MRVTIHQPRTAVEEWDLPDLPSYMTADHEILGVVRGSRPGVAARRLSASVIDSGPAFVYSRGTDDLDDVGRRLAAARAAADHVTDEAKAAALAALASGDSERAVADRLGVDRLTVRAWAGKPRRAKPTPTPENHIG